jgi:hypothetical protein
LWIPRSAAEIEDAAQRGDLEETHTFDGKEALPTPKKNRDLAVDVEFRIGNADPVTARSGLSAGSSSARSSPYAERSSRPGPNGADSRQYSRQKSSK